MRRAGRAEREKVVRAVTARADTISSIVNDLRDIVLRIEHELPDQARARSCTMSAITELQLDGKQVAAPHHGFAFDIYAIERARRASKGS